MNCAWLKFIFTPYKGFSRETWQLLIAGFVNSMALIVVIYISLYLNSLGYSIRQIGAVLTLFGLLGVAGAYLGGILTSWSNAITVCKWSLFFSAILFFIFPYLKNFIAILLISSLMGLSANLFRPAFILVLADGENKKSLESIAALRRVAINLGMSAGAGISGLLATMHFSFVFFFNALSTLIAFLILLNVKAHKHAEKKINDINVSNKSSSLIFIFMMLLMFFVLLIFNQSDATYPLFLKNQLLRSEKFISFLFMLSGLLIVCLQVPITNFFSNKNAYWVCALGALLICLGFFVLPWATSAGLIILSCLLWTLGEIIFFPAQLAMTIRLSGKNKEKNMGIYQMVFSFASFLSPAIGTTVYGFSPYIIWYLSGAVGFIAATSFLLSEKIIIPKPILSTSPKE
jgi:predicted MFS family arabinose efflux permease